MTRSRPELWPGAVALARPDRARAQDAAQLAGTWQVGAVPGTQREVLRFTRQEAVQKTPSWRWAACKFLFRVGRAVAGIRKPVVGIRPRSGLFRVGTRVRDPLNQIRELIAASLADSPEGNRVPGQIERDLVRLTGAVMAADGDDRQNGTVYAA